MNGYLRSELALVEGLTRLARHTGPDSPFGHVSAWNASPYMRRCSLWERVQPLKTKFLFPTCTLFDLTFEKWCSLRPFIPRRLITIIKCSGRSIRLWMRGCSSWLAGIVRDVRYVLSPMCRVPHRPALACGFFPNDDSPDFLISSGM